MELDMVKNYYLGIFVIVPAGVGLWLSLRDLLLSNARYHHSLSRRGYHAQEIIASIEVSHSALVFLR